MTKLLSLSALLSLAVLGTSAPLVAQDRSAVSGAELKSAAVTQSSPRAETVRELLSGDQARKLAVSMGVTAEELAERVDALDAAQLDQLAEQAGVNESSMRRRGSVVISTTAIIIILLVLILITD